MSSKGIFRLPTVIPSARALVSATTIVPGDAFSTGLFNYTLVNSGASGGDVILNGNFSDGMGFRLFNQAPSYYITNATGTIVGSATSTQHAIQNTLDCNNITFAGLDPNNPLLLRSGSAQNGVQLPSRSGGSTFTLQNIVIDTPGSSGATFNFGTGTDTYSTVDVSFLRSFNAAQEGIIYAGNTSSTFDVIGTLTVHDCFSYNSQREGIQAEHVTNGAIYKNTCILAGQSGTAGQNHALQLEDYNGYAKQCIFYKSQRPFNLFTHGTAISYCYFEFDTTFGFIGRTDNQSWSASPRLNNQPLTFDHCYFKWTGGGTLAHLTQIAERLANVTFTNCVLDGITDFFEDIRVAGYTNILTGAVGSGGNTSATITSPTFNSLYNSYSDYTYHGLCTSLTYLNQKMGYRTVG